MQPSSYAAISQRPRTHASAVQWKRHPAATGIPFDRDQQGKSEPTEVLFPVTLRSMESQVPLPLPVPNDLSCLAADWRACVQLKAGMPEKGNASSFPSGTSRGGKWAPYPAESRRPLDCVSEKRVGLVRLFSNSTPSALRRAINAYRQFDLTGPRCKRAGRTQPKRAKRLNDTQIACLVERYEAGATVYDLGSRFAIDRRTVSIHLKQQGVVMRFQPPSEKTIDEIVRLYESGLSMSKVRQQVGVSADSVLNYLRKRGVETRGPQVRPRGPRSA